MAPLVAGRCERNYGPRVFDAFVAQIAYERDGRGERHSTEMVEPPPKIRLGIYSDLRYVRNGVAVSTDNAFARFLVCLAEQLGGLTVFGRVDLEPGQGAIDLPPDLIRFVELPAYPSLHRFRQATGAMKSSLPVFERWFRELDAIWLFGPHPLALAVARLARQHRVSVFLGVRQHLPNYIKGRFPRIAAPLSFAAAWILEGAFRRLARRSPTVVVGEDLAKRWRRAAPRLLVASFALVTEEDLVPEDQAGTQPWTDPIRLLTVSRLDPEKNPLLLAAVVKELGAGWHLRVVGDGTLRRQLEERIESASLTGRCEILGHVPFGPALQDEYRACDAFVHVSNTEALPQVLFEAMAAGAPIVATAVGGVAVALGNGECGLLVPPDDAGAIAAALRNLAGDPVLRQRIARAGLREVALHTMDREASRLVDYFQASLI